MPSFKTVTNENVMKHLKTENLDISILPSVTSTNKILKKLAASGENEGKIIIALSQTDGHGRYGRKFYSDFGGLYMSILLKPDLKAVDITLLTSAVAVAVSNAIDEISGKTTTIKWVNDVLLENKKVCGILCEGGFCADEGFVIVGIGINTCPTESGFADEIKDIAATVFDSYSVENIAKLSAKVIDNLFYEYGRLNDKSFLDSYRRKSAILNKNVNIISNGKAIGSATALEIDDNCRLVVEMQNGDKKILLSDEISIKL